MAIPLIGSLSDLNQSQNMVLQSQRYLGDSLTKMGAQIGATISERQMFADAEKAAPFMQHAFMSAYDSIASNDPDGISRGLGMAVGTAAQFATNPILARLAQEGVRTAGLMTNTKMEMIQQTQQNFRTQLGIDAFNQRTQSRYNEADQKQLDAIAAQQAKLSSTINSPNTPQVVKEELKKKFDELEGLKSQFAPTQAEPLPERAAPEPPFGPKSIPEATPQGGIIPPHGDQVEGEMPQGSSAPDAIPLTEPVGMVGNVQPPSSPTQPVGSHTAAPQAQQQAVQQKTQPLWVSEDVSAVTGIIPALITKDGTATVITRTYDNDGKVTFSVKDKEGSESSVPKELGEAAIRVAENAPKINSQVADQLKAFKGIANVKVDFSTDIADGSAGYDMSFKIPTKTKDGKTVMQKVDYVVRDENGIPTDGKVSKDDKQLVEKVISDTSIIKNAPLPDGHKLVLIDPEKGSGDTTKSIHSAMAESLPATLPFRIPVEQAMKELGVKPEILSGGGEAVQRAADDLKIKAYALVADLKQNKKFDNKTPEEQRQIFVEAFTKLAQDPKESKYKLNEYVASRAPQTDLLAKTVDGIGLDKDVAAMMGESSFKGVLEFVKDATGAVGGFIGKQWNASAIDRKFAPVQSKLYTLYSSGKIKKPQYEEEKAKVAAAKNKALELIRNN